MHIRLWVLRAGLGLPPTPSLPCNLLLSSLKLASRVQISPNWPLSPPCCCWLLRGEIRCEGLEGGAAGRRGEGWEEATTCVTQGPTLSGAGGEEEVSQWAQRFMPQSSDFPFQATEPRHLSQQEPEVGEEKRARGY